MARRQGAWVAWTLFVWFFGFFGGFLMSVKLPEPSSPQLVTPPPASVLGAALARRPRGKRLFVCITGQLERLELRSKIDRLLVPSKQAFSGAVVAAVVVAAVAAVTAAVCASGLRFGAAAFVGRGWPGGGTQQRRDDLLRHRRAAL